MNTAVKRYSSVHTYLPFRGIGTLPSGTITQDERQSLALLYNGILAGAAVPVAAGARGGWSAKETKLNAKLKRLALQQARFKDEEEVLALILSLMKNN